MSLENGRLILEDTIQKIHSKRVARAVFFAWPPLLAATERLASLLGGVLPGSGKPLFEECLLEALKRYDEAPPGDISQMSAYLSGLMAPIPQVLQVSVSVKKKRERFVWQPFIESIDEWVERVSPGATPSIVEEKFLDATPESIRVMVAARIISMHDLHAIGGDIKAICQG